MSAHRFASWTAVALGVSLTVAGVVAAPASARPHAAASTANLQKMLNPAGAATVNPAEEESARQAFAASHFGGAGLSDPMALQQSLSRSIAQAAVVPQSTGAAKGWKLRGPSTYLANDPGESGSLTNLGFKNLSGRATSIATTPRKPGLVWLGTADGGVWRSTDQGAHWRPMFDGQGTLAIGSVAIDPANDKRVYVGTGEPNTNADAYYGNGMYVTNDSGAHWSHVSLPGVLTVFHVEAAGPSKGFPRGRVFAATNRGLWLSTDRGRHYSNVKLPTNAAHNGVYTATPFGNFVTDVRIRPKHVNEVVAVVGWRRGKGTEPNGRIDSVGNGFYRSTNGGKGASFRYVAQNAVTGLGAPGNNANPYGTDDPIGRTSIAYSADGRYLWAVVQDAGTMRNETFLGLPGAVAGVGLHNSVLNGVYVSTTADPSSWTPKGNVSTLGSAPGSGLLVQQADFYGPGVQSWYDQWVAVDPHDDNRVLVGLEEVYEAVANQTTPAGYASWRAVARYWNGCALLSAVDCSNVPGPIYAGFTTHPDQHAASFLPLQNGRTLLYTGSDGGIFSQLSHATDLGYTGYDNSSWRWLNAGISTTQPYWAVEGSDGTVYAGLQDNGEVKIKPGSTRGDEVYGGDGFDTAVDPRNSNVVYEEYTYGDTRVSSDGGKNWFSIAPCEVGSSTAQFGTPFVLDPRNANHIVEVGRYVDESTAGPGTLQASDPTCTDNSDQSWKVSYDLGASKVAGKPGVSSSGANNIATAVAVNGAHMYVPFCGLCDPISQGNGEMGYFHNGLATNVKPGCTARIGSSACWHKAAMRGLPNRYIQGVAIDPRNARNVYVTLTGYARRWYPNAGGGPVYVSHDAGEHFTNISGNLPHVPANAVVLRNNQVFVGTDLGVYVANAGSRKWARVGRGLPNASALDLRLNPSGSHLVAALHGRGVWTYDFGRAASPAYRQRSDSPLPVRATPSAPTGHGWTLPAVDPRLVTAGLSLLLGAAASFALQGLLGRRRRSLGLLV